MVTKAKDRPKLIDPVQLIRLCWPGVTLYKEQKEIIYSVEENPETIVPAGFKLGKDFVAGLIALTFFLRRKQARVVTTSVSYSQLNLVLWGEINNFIQSSEVDLSNVLRCNHMDIRRINNGVVDMKGYLTGITAADEQTLQGHHLPVDEDGTPNTLIIYDEASGIPDKFFAATAGWRQRLLAISNCNPCSNYFYRSVKQGDTKDPWGKIFRRTIRIKAERSPNVRYGAREEELNKPVSGRQIIPGVIGYKEYKQQRRDWDEQDQAVGLDAEFYEGAEIRLYPREWIEISTRLWRERFGSYFPSGKRQGTSNPTKGKTLGIDPAAGGDLTAFSVCDEDEESSWLCHLEALKTPDTMLIVDKAVILMHTYGIKAENVLIDLGGGGLQIADNLRRKGFKVRTVNFGGSVKDQKLAGTAPIVKREAAEERQFAYKNRRAQLYHIPSRALDPHDTPKQLLLPKELIDKKFLPNRPSVREQMEPIPKMFDDNGKMVMLPKNKKTRVPNEKEGAQITLTELIGNSPDEWEAILLALFGLYNKRKMLGGGL